jgi:hypothetical protein
VRCDGVCRKSIVKIQGKFRSEFCVCFWYNESMKTALFIDPSIRALGWAVFRYSTRRKMARLYDSGVVRCGKASGNRGWYSRLDHMVQTMENYFGRWNIATVGIEEPQSFGGSGGRGVIAAVSGDLLKLSACAFSLRQAFLDLGVGSVVMYPVRTWKGQCPKKVTEKRVRRWWGWEGKDHNESDAVGIGDYHFRKRLKYRCAS